MEVASRLWQHKSWGPVMPGLLSLAPLPCRGFSRSGGHLISKHSPTAGTSLSLTTSVGGGQCVWLGLVVWTGFVNSSH